jgi:hypothetical protein
MLGHLGHCLLSTSVLQLLKATHISMTLYVLNTPPLVGDEISTSSHTSHSRIESHCVLWHWTMFPVGLPYLNYLYDEMTCFWCPLMALWSHRWSVCPLHGEICCWMILSHVRHLLTLFLERLCKIHSALTVNLRFSLWQM